MSFSPIPISLITEFSTAISDTSDCQQDGLTESSPGEPFGHQSKDGQYFSCYLDDYFSGR